MRDSLIAETGVTKDSSASEIKHTTKVKATARIAVSIDGRQGGATPRGSGDVDVRCQGGGLGTANETVSGRVHDEAMLVMATRRVDICVRRDSIDKLAAYMAILV